MFGRTERSSGYSSAASILEQRSSLRSFIGWQTSCGDFAVPVRSKRACLRSRANFCSYPGRPRPTGPVNWGRTQSPRGSMAIPKAPARTDDAIRPAIKNRCPRPWGRSDHARRPKPSPNVSWASQILTQPCLTAWAGTKRDCGARRHKRFGRLMR